MSSREFSFGHLFIMAYLLFAVVYCLNAFNFASANTPNNKVLSTQDDININQLNNSTEKEVFALINQQRASRGLSELSVDTQLQNVAKTRASEMSRLGYYSHATSSGGYYYDMLENTKFNKNFSCENLELEFTNDSQLFVKQWLGSSSHRDCLLNPTVTDVGYAFAPIKLGESSNIADAFLVVAIYGNDNN